MASGNEETKVSVDPSAEGTVAEPVEQTVEVKPAQRVPPVVSPPDAGWNGEIESLEKQSWYGSLPEEARRAVAEGLKAKLGNYDRGYQGKLEAASKAQKAAEAKLKDAEAKLKLAELFGDDEEIQREKAELAELRKDRDARNAAAKAEAERREAESITELQEKYPDIIMHESDAVAEQFAGLVEAGLEPDEAAEIVRKKHKLVKPEAPYKAAARMANSDSAVPSSALAGGRRYVDLNSAMRSAQDEVAREFKRTR